MVYDLSTLEFTEPTEISDNENPSTNDKGFTEPTPEVKPLRLTIEINFLCKFSWTGKVEILELHEVACSMSFAK